MILPGDTIVMPSIGHICFVMHVDCNQARGLIINVDYSGAETVRYGDICYADCLEKPEVMYPDWIVVREDVK